MYHTLVPQSERLALRRAYRRRYVVVLCFALSIAGIIGIVSLIPSLLFVSIERKSAEIELASLIKAKDMSGLTEIQQQVAVSQGLLVHLAAGAVSPRSSDLIEDVVRNRGNVRLTSVALTQVSTSSASMTIRGVAPTRESLLSFKGRLLTSYPGSKVDLPVSELARSADINFSIQLIRKLP
ncbi:MAG: hypothetical protein WC648_03155 [Candidatus Paceibacterota bacterium]|jgi:hypothetical protein